MRLKLFSNNTIKSLLKNLLFSFLISSLLACSESPPTYSRKDIEKTIKELCKKEFAIDVKVTEVGDTIWVYAPMKNIANEKGDWNEKISKNIDRIYLSLTRVILSMDKRPRFYCFVVSDIKAGFDLYYVWFIRDLVMAVHEFISRGEFQERRVVIYCLNPQALNDEKGKHIYMYNISLGEFIAALIKQNLEKKFTTPELKSNFAFNELESEYFKEKLTVRFNIGTKKAVGGSAKNAEEVEKTVKKFLKIYEYPQDIQEVEIYDTFAKKHDFFGRRTLMEGR
jgi:hypothetical protein